MPSRNFVLRSLGSAVETLAPSLRPVSFRRGEAVNLPDGRVTRVLFPVAGLISVRTVLASGHELECALVGRTNVLGGPAAIGFDLSLTQDICLTQVHAWSIDMERLRLALSEDPSIERQIKRFSFVQLGYAVQIGVCNAMHAVEPRLARWLVTAADLLQQSEIPMAQDELAKVLGVQRTAVNPLLQRFRGQGYIDLHRGKITICDRKGLVDRACECRPTLQQALQLEATASEQSAEDAPFGI